MTPDYTKHQVLSMKKGEIAWSEKFIQDLIFTNSEILGLGKFTNVTREHTQATGGRVDLILSGDNLSARYVVEIQLGKTDADHIVRTLEYWDQERKWHPNVDHVAVLIAEEITGRFYSVISLLNEKIPIIALKMTAIEMGGKTSVLFTKIVEISPQPRRSTSREAGEAPTSAPGDGLPRDSSASMRSLFGDLKILAEETLPDLTFEPHQSYASVKYQNWNVVSLLPRKAEMRVVLHVERDSVMDALLTESGLDYKFDPLRNRYVVHVTPESFELRRKQLGDALRHVAKAWQGHS